MYLVNLDGPLSKLLVHPSAHPASSLKAYLFVPLVVRATTFTVISDAFNDSYQPRWCQCHFIHLLTERWPFLKTNSTINFFMVCQSPQAVVNVARIHAVKLFLSFSFSFVPIALSLFFLSFLILFYFNFINFIFNFLTIIQVIF